MSEIIIGIDLGTSNSEVAVFTDGKIEIVEENGSPIIPSYVGLDKNSNIVVGYEARNQYALYPEQTIRSIKREMGTNKKFPLGDIEYLPQEISAMILKKLKTIAEKYLKREVSKAVITVPAQFNDAQRQATREAGAIAGLEVMRIINEPTAACLAYEQAAKQQAKKVLAFDLGGGTFDVSVVTVEDDIVEVISSHGDNHLGGDDMDNKIEAWILKQIYDKQQTPALITELSQLKLKHTAETAKIHLTDYPHSKIIEDNLTTKNNTIESINTELSRLKFEEMIQPLLDKMLLAVHEALADAHLKPKDIDEIILVGGATRVPVILEILEKELGKRPRRDVHPDLVVAYGAGIMAARLMGKEDQRILVDITPYTFGTSCVGPLNGEYVPYFFSPVLKAGTPLPASKAKSYYTMFDNQKAVDIKIFQGEDSDARKNILVGDFEINGLSAIPAGNEVILNMRLDLDGILRVTAIEKRTNLQKDIKIKDALNRLTDEQIKKSQEKVLKLFKGSSFTANGNENEQETDYGKHDANEIAGILNKITAKVKRYTDKMDDADKKDSRDLLDTLKKAVDQGDEIKFNKTLTELNDLLFYLET